MNVPADYSGWLGAGVELAWRKAGKSSKTTAEACVEMAAVSEVFLLRDSKDPSGPVLVLTRAELTSLLESVRSA